MIELTVTVTTMPESNGKTNHCAFLHRKDEPKQNGITIAWSEYPDRVRYEADRYRYMIGELDKKPYILDYDATLHSGWVNPDRPVVLGVYNKMLFKMLGVSTIFSQDKALENGFVDEDGKLSHNQEYVYTTARKLEE